MNDFEEKTKRLLIGLIERNGKCFGQDIYISCSECPIHLKAIADNNRDRCFKEGEKFGSSKVYKSAIDMYLTLFGESSLVEEII